MSDQELRQKCELLRIELDFDRTTFEKMWRDIDDYMRPIRGRFFVTDAGKGNRRSNKILDPTATIAARTLPAGMMSLHTSPARPWFELTHPNQELAEEGEPKEWLDDVTKRMRTQLLKTNFYEKLPQQYADMGSFGPGAIFAQPDDEEVLRFFHFPVGSYFIANDAKGRVRTFLREFQMTIRQLIEEFAEQDEKGNITNWDVFSAHVKSQYKSGSLDLWVDMVHVVMPNPEYNPRRLGSEFKHVQGSKRKVDCRP